MMRKLLVLGAAMVAILSLATIAQGEEHESSHIWFFGECENQYDSPYYDSSVSGASFLGHGCRGIGIFAGQWVACRVLEHGTAGCGDRENQQQAPVDTRAVFWRKH